MRQDVSTAPHLITACPLIEEILDPHRDALGPRYAGTRNHAFRVLNLARCSAPATSHRDSRLAIAAAFHDLPAMLDGDLVYLDRAADLADAFLAAKGHPEWSAEIRLMIVNHHKIRPYRVPSAPMVEAVRRADWLDASARLWRGAVPREFVREVDAVFPLSSLYLPGLRLVAEYAVRHPRRPLPMVRW